MGGRFAQLAERFEKTYQETSNTVAAHSSPISYDEAKKVTIVPESFMTPVDKGSSIQVFVNREEELKLIEDALDILCGGRLLLRTPIIEFYGVEGIGKTTLLNEIKEKCDNKHVSCVWEDLASSSSNHFLNTVEQLVNEKEPVVLILDSLDRADEKWLLTITEWLGELMDNSNFFVILASRKRERFDNNTSIVRKLTIRHLKPFNRENCDKYVHSEGVSDTEIMEEFYRWTRGYPLAMQVMAEFLSTTDFHIGNMQDQAQFIAIMAEKVIDERLLRQVENASWYRMMLSLFSVPRRFNLVIMQEIIEQIAPQESYQNRLAYIGLPNKINQATYVLNWDTQRGGYYVDASIRNIFLLEMKITKHQQYVDIHRFLARINERLFGEVTGLDRVRYLLEYFYHIASSEEEIDLPLLLTQHIEQLLQDKLETSLEQFKDEFSQDEELQEVLGSHTSLVLSLLRQNEMPQNGD